MHPETCLRCVARVVAVILLAAPAVAAQPSPSPTTPAANDAGGFTLADALRVAARSHPRLASTRSELRAAEHDAAAAGLWTNPQLGIAYMRSFGYTTFDPDIGVAQVGVTQMIETAGVPARRRLAAEGERDAARAELEHARRSVVLDVGAAFVRLGVACARRTELRESLARAERITALVNARVAAGTAPGYERTRAALARSDARAMLAAAEADITAARGAFDVAVGPGAVALRGEPAGGLPAMVALPPLAQVVGDLSETRADIEAERARERAARARIDVARREAVPGFALYGGLLVGQGYGEQGQRQVDFMVGVTVPLPVANSGREAALAAEARAAAAHERVAAGLAEARIRVASAWTEARQRRDALAEFQADAADQERLLNETTVAYRDGRVPIQALIDAHDAIRDARLRALELTAAAREAEARLWTAVGLLPDVPPP